MKDATGNVPNAFKPGFQNNVIKNMYKSPNADERPLQSPGTIKELRICTGYD